MILDQRKVEAGGSEADQKVRQNPAVFWITIRQRFIAKTQS